MTRYLNISIFIIILFAVFAARGKSSSASDLPQAGSAEQLRTGMFFISDEALNPDLQFETQQGTLITSEDFRGHYSVFFFGYSSCPSFCPEIVEHMSSIARALPRPYSPMTPVKQKHLSAEIDFYFVSIDPENDTPEQMAQFLKNYPSPITGLITPIETVDEMAEYFRVHVAHARGEDGHIAHSASLVMLDPLGRACGVITNLNDTKAVAQDLVSIVRRLKPSVEKALATGASQLSA